MRNGTIQNNTQSGVITQCDSRGTKPEILRIDNIPKAASTLTLATLIKPRSSRGRATYGGKPKQVDIEMAYFVTESKQ